MFRHPDPEVLVVGAGPGGLVTALFLQKHGGDDLEPLLEQIGLTAAPSHATPRQAVSF